MLKRLGVKSIHVYDNGNSTAIRKNMGNYDMIINCARTSEKVLRKKDLEKMKPASLLVDIGGDCIECGCEAQSIFSPVTTLNNGRNYVYRVDHVPSIAYKTATKYISKACARFINILSEGDVDKILSNAIVVSEGIVDQERIRTEYYKKLSKK